MAYFYSIRGWLEVEPDNFASVTGLIQSLQASYLKDTKIGLYLQGWCWNSQPVNWTQYVFYGADITEDGLELFKDTLSKLITLKGNLSGYFHAQGEDGEKNFVYRVVDDRLMMETDSILVAVT
ncbi:hypothetical protein [Scytonema sp. NUACC26]|uniref:hypothetical protein n=1 Tax=Scytonema sp. NUACC26 TaxID=3140176 RepID=UPI0038B24145